MRIAFWPVSERDLIGVLVELSGKHLNQRVRIC